MVSFRPSVPGVVGRPDKSCEVGFSECGFSNYLSYRESRFTGLGVQGLHDYSLRARRVRQMSGDLIPLRWLRQRPTSTQWLRTRLVGVVGLILAHHVFSPNTAAQVSPTRAALAIKEGMFVQIGGIDQWITIKGGDRNNPVVFFLHGGPGDALSPFADAMFGAWEKDFTLVQWDQRGAGRTYGKNGPAIELTMTVERMTDDG
jgi:hypothetical protein